MKKWLIGIPIGILMITLLSVIWYRVTSSNEYKKWFTNYVVFDSWSTLELQWKNQYSIYVPLDTDSYAFQLKWMQVAVFFLEFDILGWKEYKPLSDKNVDMLPGGISVFNNEWERYLTEIGLLSDIIRNSFLDKGGKITGVVIWTGPRVDKGKISITKLDAKQDVWADTHATIRTDTEQMSWVFGNITLRDKIVSYHNFLQFELPEAPSSWDHYTSETYLGDIWKESLHIDMQHWDGSISCNLSVYPIDDTAISDEDLCSPKSLEWVLKYETTQRTIDNQNVFIESYVYSKSWPDIEPFQFDNITACWVKDNVKFSVACSNQKKDNRLDDINSIIDSIKIK